MALPLLTGRVYNEIERRGLDPIYVDTTHFPEDYIKRGEVAMADERLVSLMTCGQRGFDTSKHCWEIMVNMPHNFTTICGVVVDETFESPTLKGLFAVGDAASGLASCGPGIQSAFLCGESLPSHVGDAGEPVIDEGQLETQRRAAYAPIAVSNGTEPMEFECAVRWINTRYVGQHKSEGKLREGLRRLQSLREHFLPDLMAANPHYLMRCLEARNILELTELHLVACLDRKESRGNYMRTDYPERDPLRDGMIAYQSIKNGEPVLDIRRPPALKPEHAEVN
jgi:succinate dehydrogenase/fumarate reductase flavoprotein subunit